MIKKLLKGIVLLAVAVMLFAAWVAYDIQQFMHTKLVLSDEGAIVKVDHGSNLTRIAYQLKKQGVIDNPRYLIWYARWTTQANKIHVGEYQLTTGMTPQDFLDSVANGDVIQYSFTLVEGWSFKQVLAALEQNEYIKHTLKGLNQQQVMEQLGLKDKHPEGQFLPDTYLFPRDIKDTDVLKRSYNAMQAFLDSNWDTRDVGLPVNSPYEALILASIVEKETGLATERPAIAGVFSRRLIKRMRLQSDPTVIYGMGDRYKGNIRRRDLREATPYNTYKIFGLTPTPIAMPGRDAIMAVLRPEDGNSLYFVAKGDGSHYFSATLKEHNEAVIQYQLKGRRRPFSSYKAN